MEQPATNWDPTPQRGLVSRTLWQAGIFGAYFAQFVKMRLAYRMDFFVDTLAVSFSMVIQLAVLTTLFSKVKPWRAGPSSRSCSSTASACCLWACSTWSASICTGSATSTSSRASSTGCCCGRWAPWPR